MDFNSPYAVLDGENEYSHADSFYQHHDLSGLDPALAGDDSLEQATIQRFLEEEEDPRRLWEMTPTPWPGTPSMGMSYPATPTLEPNDRSSTPDSFRLPSLPPNSSRPVRQGSLLRYGESQRPLTPLDSAFLTSTPGAFAEEDHSTPRAALMGLSITDDTREVVGNTIHVQMPNQIPSFRPSLGPNTSTPFPLKEENIPAKALETIPPVFLMSPPMQPHPLPKSSFTRPQIAASVPSKPKTTGKNKNRKQSPKTPGPTKVLKPRQRSTAKSNLKANAAINIFHSKFTAAISQLSDWECNKCEFSCKDYNTLDKHIKSDHARPFFCIFQFAGCDDRFAAKNEWKRHVMSQHVVAKVNVCTYGVCAQNNDKPTRSQTKYLDVEGKQFNRKDLYDSHIRRMHPYPATKKQSLKQWEDLLKILLRQSIHIRCSTPTYLECPSPDCNLSFEGDDAWDQRMEHTARHMEMAASGDADDIVIGGDNDRTLIEWASAPEVGVIKRVSGQWKVCFPSKKKKQSKYKKRK
ncbi:unnamed protein product [Clonostachys solani]|uniref:C2H2-type domain-containing protein n=1 Tax=Clonostachys solani TaxID=160281 RepID=A0A9N9ZCW5_9HYPO|nr:unnamed protein product [Clonostachys solani]